jgi:tRNA dimethylallyltransferase
LSADPLLLVILGPTGSGKTALSLALADKFRGEIVNCDSVAVYREFNIGTAKPTPEEQARVPHHLFDVLDPTGFTTAGEYSRRARPVLRAISARGSLPIVAGGTGLYLRALLDGLFAGPERSEQLRSRLRHRIAQKGAAHLHRVLSKLDRRASAAIHANDVPKVIRAIEVCLTAKRPMSEQWSEGRDALQGFRIVRIGLDPGRPQLYQRINQRVLSMFDAGLLDETTQLRQKYGEAAPALNSIGYRQAVQVLKGEIDREAAIGAVQQAHRKYAKRQMTWFRREPGVHWIPGFGDSIEAIREATGLVNKHKSAPDYTDSHG